MNDLEQVNQEPIEGEYIAAGESEEPVLNASQRAAHDRARPQDEAVAREWEFQMRMRQAEAVRHMSREEMVRRQQGAAGMGGGLYGLGGAGLGIFG